MEKPSTRSSGQPLSELKEDPEKSAATKKITIRERKEMVSVKKEEEEKPEESVHDPSESVLQLKTAQRRSFGFIDMRPLPSYSGKKIEDVDLWIEKVKNFQRSRGWSDDETFSHVLTVLEGRALEAAHSLGSDGSLEELYDLLIQNFGIVDEAAEQRKLLTLEMFSEESVDDFVFRVRQLQRRSKATERQAINAFKFGLKENWGQWVSNAKPNTLDEAIAIARNCEMMALQIKAKDPDAALLQQLLILKKENSDLKKKNEDLETDRPKQVNVVHDRPKNDLKCYYCGRPGHFARECFKKKADNESYYQSSPGRGRGAGTARRGGRGGGRGGRGRFNQKN